MGSEWRRNDDLGMTRCGLCGGIAEMYLFDPPRRYRQCTNCRLVYLERSFWPTPELEQRHYDLHENDPADAGYRRFLSRLFEPMHERLAPGSCGLDFGSGPGPTLSVMFEEAGHDMRIYDPFYAADESAFASTYDFITASEVVEHLHVPGREFNRIWSLLKPGGWLGIMTKRVRDREAFRSWHYRQDPTHVSFFSTATFEWLAGEWSAELDVDGPDVVIFRRPE